MPPPQSEAKSKGRATLTGAAHIGGPLLSEQRQADEQGWELPTCPVAYGIVI